MVAEPRAMTTDSPSRQVTVVDVYDLASGIGKDFERIIEQFGSDSVTSLMPKVISSLELLEAFASRNERENEEIICLKSTVDRLELEKAEKKKGRQTFEKELEQIEENYRNEIQQLWDMVQRLQEENKRMLINLQEKELHSPTLAFKEEDLKMMLTLRENVDHQRDQLKSLQKENQDKQLEFEALQQQVDKLQRVNKELGRKNKAVQNQGRELVEEKAELLTQLLEKDHVLETLKEKLGETEKARKDLEQSKVEETQGLDRDNVPRFTLAELREVLQEKNQLKARVMELEEELAQLRPVPTPSPQPPEKSEDEVLVYGPINQEPDEKLNPWKYQRKDAGVRRFFHRLWSKTSDRKSTGGTSSANTSDRRDSQTRSPPSVSFSKRTVAQAVRYRPATSSPLQRSEAVRISSSSASEAGVTSSLPDRSPTCDMDRPLEFSLNGSSSSFASFHSRSFFR